MSRWQIIDRKEFVELRYLAFKNKRELFGDMPGVYMTDLDGFTESGRALYDVVICDRCNEDILTNFVMYENTYVFHPSCLTDSERSEVNNMLQKKSIPENVVYLKPGTKK